ncbi:MAG: hypothetical protein RIT43_1478 [Bacteroidota bacterium]|jgi:alkaline phosphatase D
MLRYTWVFLFGIIGQAWSQLPNRIAFGSCGHQDKTLEIFNTISDINPDLFIFLGDNIYGDTENMRVLRKKYRKLGRNAHFSRLKSHTKILATWDDHDYGANDAGKYYPKKNRSKKEFLKFFREPILSERRNHEGIYTSYFFKDTTGILQIILLDCRTFRNNLLPYDGSLKKDTTYTYPLDYSPHLENSDSTLLGEEQWRWLEEELKKPATVRMICSSTQFATQYNGYEAWANFPGEQRRMAELIKKTRADGVVFISGDVHYAELSVRQFPDMYPIHDLTSSGLTEEWKFATPNAYRIGNPVMENHFGLIELNWAEKKINLEIKDFQNTTKLSHEIEFTELKF